MTRRTGGQAANAICPRRWQIENCAEACATGNAGDPSTSARQDNRRGDAPETSAEPVGRGTGLTPRRRAGDRHGAGRRGGHWKPS